MSELGEFLAGERPDDVAIYFAEDHLDDPERLAGYGEPVDGGLVLVVAGDRGREVFSRAVGVDAMGFARTAMGRTGTVADDLAGGVCPEGDGHGVRFVFAFAEEENGEAGGLYAEGDVIHAYAQCECGVAYSDRWVADGTA